MSANALYYPYIDIPSTVWTAQAILYWDKLASIIPMDHMDRPAQMTPLMRTLLVEGLVEPIIPGMFLYEVKDFDKTFIDFLKRTMLASENPTRLVRRGLTTLIHAEKMGEIPDFLIASGLAEKQQYPWFRVDADVAKLFMAYLATVLSALPSVNATAITDKPSLLTVLNCPPSSAARADTKASTRQIVLDSLIPVPTGKLDPHKLLEFKARHGELLPSLRLKIEAHCAKVAGLDDEDLMLATAAFTEECKEQVDEIQARMYPTFGSVVLNTITPVFSAGLTFASTGEDNKLALGAAGITLAHCAWQAIRSIRSGDERKPLAYIAHARKSFS